MAAKAGGVSHPRDFSQTHPTQHHISRSDPGFHEHGLHRCNRLYAELLGLGAPPRGYADWGPDDQLCPQLGARLAR